jgi:hypothetical protein
VKFVNRADLPAHMQRWMPHDPRAEDPFGKPRAPGVVGQALEYEASTKGHSKPVSVPGESGDPNLVGNEDLASSGRSGGGGAGGGYAGPSVIGAHWDPSRLPITQGDLEQEEALRQKQLDIRSRQFDIEDAQMKTVAEIEKQKAMVQEQHTKQMAAQRAEEEIAKKYQLDALKERQTAVENFQMDPSRVITNNNALFKAGFIVKALLDGALAGFTGRPNEFNKFTDAILKMDQDVQRASFDKLTRAEAIQRNRMADYEKLTGSKRAAMLQNEVDKLSAIEVMLKQRMADIPGAPSTWGGTPGTPGTRGIMSKARMRYEAAMQDIAAQKLARQEQIHTATYVPAQVLGGGGGGGKSNVNEDRLVRDLNGEVYEMRSGEKAKEISDQVAAGMEFDRLTRRVNKLRESPDAFIPGTDAHAELEAIGEQAMYVTGRLNKAGALDEGRVRSAQKQLSDPASLFSRSGHKFDVVNKMIQGAIADNIKGGFGEKVQKKYDVDASGNVKRKSGYKGTTANPAVTPQGFKPVGSK